MSFKRCNEEVKEPDKAGWPLECLTTVPVSSFLTREQVINRYGLWRKCLNEGQNKGARLGLSTDVLVWVYVLRDLELDDRRRVDRLAHYLLCQSSNQRLLHSCDSPFSLPLVVTKASFGCWLIFRTTFCLLTLAKIWQSLRRWLEEDLRLNMSVIMRT